MFWFGNEFQKAIDSIFDGYNFSLTRFCWKESGGKYIKKRNLGVALYEKPKRNEFVKAHSKPLLNRRLMTLRVQTHTKK